MATDTVVQATPEQALAVFFRVDELLGTLGDQLARLPIAGELNLEQSERVRFAVRLVDGLRKLFDEERARQFPATRIRES